MDIKITKHAMERFNDRNEDPTACKNPEKTITKLIEFAYPIEFSKEHRVKRLLSNGFEDADYLYNNGWIFVCSKGNPKTIVTIERQGDRKFGRDLFKINKEKS